MDNVADALHELLVSLVRGASEDRLNQVASEASVVGEERERVQEATGLALRIRQTLAEHRRREAELAALFATASDLAALRDLDAVLRSIVRRARMLLGADTAYLTLSDEQAGDTYMRVTDGSVSAVFQQVRVGLGIGLGGLVAQTSRPYASADYFTDDRFLHSTTVDTAVRDEGLVAILGVPLKLGSTVIGVLYAADRSPREFPPQEISLLSSLASHAAIAIDSARLLEETRHTLADLDTATEAMRHAEQAHDRLTGLVLHGADVPEVAAALAGVLDGGIVVYDVDGTELARVGTGPLTAPQTPPPAMRAISRDGNWVCAVRAGQQLLGSILLTGRAELPEADRRLFERASVVTALLLMLQRSTAEAENKVRGELLTDLLATAERDAAALIARARRLGVDLAAEHLVVAAAADAAPRERLAMIAADYARTNNGLAGEHGHHIALLVPGHRDPRSVADDLSARLGCPVTAGAAGPAAGPVALAAAHAEAQRCLQALFVLGQRGHARTARELGFAGLVLGDRADVATFVESTIGPVLDYDTRRGTELVRTMSTFFGCGANLTRTKDVLHVHVNTVVQRLERISTLLGSDWQTPERALEIQLALRLHQLTGAGAVG